MTDNHIMAAQYKNGYWFGLIKRRVIASGQNSLSGLTSCFKHEEAFRVEIILAIPLIPIGWWLAETLLECLILTSVTVLVLITELLNSAIEATVDRVGLDYHDLAKRAKDVGSAAVLLSMLLFLVVWVSIIAF